MKAQLTFLSIFMKVLLMLLILALCFTGNFEKEPACTEGQQNTSTLSVKGVTNGLLNSAKSVSTF